MEKQQMINSSEELSKQLQEHELKGSFDDASSYQMNKRIEKKMEDFDLQKRQNNVKSIEGFRKIYITS